MTHDQIIVSLPFERSLGPFKYVKKKEVGFLFTNLTKHLFSIEMELNSHDELTKWVGVNGMDKFMNEVLCCAAQSFVGIYKKMPYKKDQLQKALNAADKETKLKIVQTFEKSQTFGATVKKKPI